MKKQPEMLTVKAMTAIGLVRFKVLKNIRPKFHEQGVLNSMLYKVVGVEGAGPNLQMRVRSYKGEETLYANKENFSKFYKVVEPWKGLK